MAFLGDTFDWDNTPANSEFDPIPNGWYDVDITETEVKPTSAGNGQYLSVKYTVVGPTHQGRTVFGNITLRNPNATAEKIGREQLGKIIRACGIPKLSDSDQLHGCRLKVKVSTRKYDKDGEEREANEVKDFKPMDGSALPKAAANQQSTPQPATAGAGGSLPPWAKK